MSETNYRITAFSGPTLHQGYNLEHYPYRIYQPRSRLRLLTHPIGFHIHHAEWYYILWQQLKVPILHIADATALAIQAKDIRKVAFLGTKYSMVEDFVTQRIANHHIEVYTPESKEDIEELHRIIQQELTYGNIVPKSKDYVKKVIQSLVDKGAEGVVLGCTEFPLMIKPGDLQITIFNTTEIHAQAGVDFIMQDFR